MIIIFGADKQSGDFYKHLSRSAVDANNIGGENWQLSSKEGQYGIWWAFHCMCVKLGSLRKCSGINQWSDIFGSGHCAADKDVN